MDKIVNLFCHTRLCSEFNDNTHIWRLNTQLNLAQRTIYSWLRPIICGSLNSLRLPYSWKFVFVFLHQESLSAKKYFTKMSKYSCKSEFFRIGFFVKLNNSSINMEKTTSCNSLAPHLPFCISCFHPVSNYNVIPDPASHLVNPTPFTCLWSLPR